jgi:hypothetical protein
MMEIVAPVFTCPGGCFCPIGMSGIGIYEDLMPLLNRAENGIGSPLGNA